MRPFFAELLTTSGVPAYTITNNSGLSIGSISGSGTAFTWSSIVPAALGDILVLGFRLSPNASEVSSLSGGGVSNWIALQSVYGGGAQLTVALYYGVVTSTSSSSLTMTMVSSTSNVSGNILEFSKSGGNWALGSGAAQGTTGSAILPSLTPTYTKELYIGFGCCQTSALSAGSNSGYTYVLTGGSGYSGFAYDTNVSTTQSPSFTCNQNTNSSAQLFLAN